MSIQAVAWALELEIPDALAKLVLVSLATQADHKTGRALSQPRHRLPGGVVRAAHGAGEDPLAGAQTVPADRARLRPPDRPPAGEFRPLLRLGMVSEETAKLAEAEDLVAQGLEGGRVRQMHPPFLKPREGAPCRTGGCARAHGGGCSCAHPQDASVRREPREEADPPVALPGGGLKAKFLFGKKSDHLERACEAIADSPDNATAGLQAAGFRVDANVKVSDRGDGRGGRLALVARKGLTTIAVVQDEAEIRPRDLTRLACITELVPAGGLGYRLGVVRRSPATTCPAGVDVR